MIKYLLIPFFTIPLLFSMACAQTAKPDSIIKDQSINNTLLYYNKSIGQQSEIYNGIKYVFVTDIKGTPFFMDKEYWTPSVIKYNGTWYKNISIIYDLYQNVLVALSYDGATGYVLRSGKVSDFFLLNHHFVYIVTTNINNGFYDQLHDGSSEVLVKRTKLKAQNIDQQIITYYFNEIDDIFIKHGDKYYAVTSKSQLIDILKDKKTELNHYIKSEHLNYKRNREEFIAKIAGYYDQLTK